MGIKLCEFLSLMRVRDGNVLTGFSYIAYGRKPE
jgi:hypothetical protein